MDLRQAKDYTEKLFKTKWVKWIHEGSISAKTSSEKSMNVILGSIGKHCSVCLNLNECCFTENNCPTIPLHPNCHCITIDINAPNIHAECPIEKFTKYVFANGSTKKELFELWGYDIIDSEYLQNELERQAELDYSIGDYTLGKLDDFGQRINIAIKLKRKNKEGYIIFISGWMVYPDGKIILITPYGDK